MDGFGESGSFGPGDGFGENPAMFPARRRAAARAQLEAVAGGRRVRKGAGVYLTSRRGWLVSGAVAALAAVGIVITAFVPAGAAGPGASRLPVAQALAFTRAGGYIDVTVRDPLAGAARFRAEFAAHGMHITLAFAPVPAALAGVVLAVRGPFSAVPAHVTCEPSVQTFEVRVPAGYHGPGTITFGRTAGPGEPDPASRPVPGPRYQGRTYAAATNLLRAHGLTVTRIYAGMAAAVQQPTSRTLTAGQVPAGWRVDQATEWAPGRAVLWVGDAAVPAACSSATVRPTPTRPAPSPTITTSCPWPTPTGAGGTAAHPCRTLPPPSAWPTPTTSCSWPTPTPAAAAPDTAAATCPPSSRGPSPTPTPSRRPTSPAPAPSTPGPSRRPTSPAPASPSPGV